jgi:hypothetical protein
MSKLISDETMEEIVTPETESTDTSTMIYRNYRGMEAVAQFDEEETDYRENRGDNE